MSLRKQGDKTLSGVKGHRGNSLSSLHQPDPVPGGFEKQPGSQTHAVLFPVYFCI